MSATDMAHQVLDHLGLDLAEHDRQLAARVRDETIAECQRWLHQGAATVERWASFLPEHAERLNLAAHIYRSAAGLLEVLRP